MVKLICFDLDGVLVDTVDWHYKSFNQALKTVANYEIPEREHELYYNGRPTPIKLEILKARDILQTQDQVDEIATLKSRLFQDMVQEHMQTDLSKIGLMLNLKDEGYKIAVVSNCNFKNTYLLLEKIGVVNLIDLRISANDVERPKPDPEGYLSAMAHFEVRPSETLIFEDSRVGVTAAVNSGANVIVVNDVRSVDWSYVKNHIHSFQEPA